MTAPARAGRPLAGIAEHPSEREFQRRVIDLAHTFGWRVAHFRTAINARGRYMTPVGGDGAGFPDLVLVHRERGLVWFRELKAGRQPRRPLDPAQVVWYDTLRAAGSDIEVWTPIDWPEIVTALSNGRAQVS